MFLSVLMLLLLGWLLSLLISAAVAVVQFIPIVLVLVAHAAELLLRYFAKRLSRSAF